MAHPLCNFARFRLFLPTLIVGRNNMLHQIFIPQPHATMVVRGERDVIRNEHFSPGDCILVNAIAPKDDPDTPLEWRQEVINQQLFGNLAPTKDLPVNKCLGVVKVLEKAKKFYSKWSKLEPSVVVYKALVFDDPQPIGKRKLGDLGDIPSHKFHPRDVHVTNSARELVIPVDKSLYTVASKGGTVTFEMCGFLLVYTLFDRGILKKFDTFRLNCGQLSKTFYWNEDCDVEWEQDTETAELIMYPSVYAKSGFAPRARLHLSCRLPFIY